ncbi:hypothetical protein U9M48_041246 [Paspalum notatum var. saurae]|uniref:Secreted protein n=1 Tax=Paspalum notatum var. saurae TaxID=547442 RepID=A0AAQ3UNC9_PASNO
MSQLLFLAPLEMHVICALAAAHYCCDCVLRPQHQILHGAAPLPLETTQSSAGDIQFTGEQRPRPSREVSAANKIKLLIHGGGSLPHCAWPPDAAIAELLPAPLV